MGKVFLKMKYSELLMKINLLNGVFNKFVEYSNELDLYFANEENVKNHKELYDLYINLTFEIDKLKKRKKIK